jgi:hypothetical protein
MTIRLLVSVTAPNKPGENPRHLPFPLNLARRRGRNVMPRPPTSKKTSVRMYLEPPETTR